MLPFGPSIAGYARFATSDRDVTANLPGVNQAQSLRAEDELKGDKLDPAKAGSLMIPLMGWLVLASAVFHSTRRLTRWSRLEEA